ncbi:MAG: hypothetical protein EOP34_06445, partial [Rickettsiales bacterium]
MLSYYIMTSNVIYKNNYGASLSAPYISATANGGFIGDASALTLGDPSSIVITDSKKNLITSQYISPSKGGFGLDITKNVTDLSYITYDPVKNNFSTLKVLNQATQKIIVADSDNNSQISLTPTNFNMSNFGGQSFISISSIMTTNSNPQNLFTIDASPLIQKYSQASQTKTVKVIDNVVITSNNTQNANNQTNWMLLVLFDTTDSSKSYSHTLNIPSNLVTSTQYNLSFTVLNQALSPFDNYKFQIQPYNSQNNNTYKAAITNVTLASSNNYSTQYNLQINGFNNNDPKCPNQTILPNNTLPGNSMTITVPVINNRLTFSISCDINAGNVSDSINYDSAMYH